MLRSSSHNGGVNFCLVFRHKIATLLAASWHGAALTNVLPQCYAYAVALTNVAAATQILANALKGLDSLREQSKSSKDATLKENISQLYDNLLDLKAAVLSGTGRKRRIEA
jgi:hypothetical protein